MFLVDIWWLLLLDCLVMNAFSWFLLVSPSSVPGLPLCIDRDVLQWCDVLRGPLVAQVGMSVPRLWGANMTRAGCMGRRLLKLCRVSVAVHSILRLGQSCNDLFFSFNFLIPFNTLLVTLPGLSIFSFQFYKLFKVPWGWLLILISFCLYLSFFLVGVDLSPLAATM